MGSKCNEIKCGEWEPNKPDHFFTIAAALFYRPLWHNLMAEAGQGLLNSLSVFVTAQFLLIQNVIRQALTCGAKSCAQCRLSIYHPSFAYILTLTAARTTNIQSGHFPVLVIGFNIGYFSVHTNYNQYILQSLLIRVFPRHCHSVPMLKETIEQLQSVHDLSSQTRLTHPQPSFPLPSAGKSRYKTTGIKDVRVHT